MSATPRIVPLAAILPTRNRAMILSRFLDSLETQDTLPAQMVVCDASDDESTAQVINARSTAWMQRFGPTITWTYERAHRLGLAPQRNQAVTAATQPFVWFLDDDMILESDCVRHLFDAIATDDSIGGVTATLTNEPYHPPGRATRALMQWFEGGIERDTYASACVGPGWTFLHDDAREGPALMPAEWLGGGCTIYRKAALDVPAVPDHFEGGAIGEDVAASVHVAQSWQTFHVRAARAIHDSQGGSHKRSLVRLADQGIRHRYYIMTRIMGRDTPRDVLNFIVMWLFSLTSLLRSPRTWKYLAPNIAGYLTAVWKISQCRIPSTL
jgi:GT2 family glycosyltransferase